MTLQEILTAVNDLDETELNELQQHIAQLQAQKRASEFLKSAKLFSADLNEEDVEAIEWAMNVESSKSVDEDLF